LKPCLRGEFGALEAQGGNIVPARDDRRAWLALGAVGRARWILAGPIFVELEAGLRVPLVRAQYFFEPNNVVHRPPAVGAIAAAGLGVSFL
jgi:hypothetical protein